MNTANLIRMANSIADYFAGQGDRAEALAGIAGHIRKFWEPRMRQALLEALDAEAAIQQLQPIVREAIDAHRLTLGI